MSSSIWSDLKQTVRNIFGGDKSSSFLSFYKRIVNWKANGVYPFAYNLPNTISLPSSFWKDITKIYTETNNDGLERAISLFWADGELVVTSVVKGDSSSVVSNHTVNVQYVAHPTKNTYARKEVLADGKVIQRKDVYYKNIPKKVSVEYLFNMHTHPVSVSESGIRTYSFFSLQDIRSLISSGAVVTGLVTDRLYLIVRTSDTPTVFDIDERELNVQTLKERLKLVVYVAEFQGKAIKQ